MEKQSRPYSFEFWGGIECTLNRVRDNYFDQLEFTGHYHRSDDIERIASLGITTMRYPVLWELHERYDGGAIDFSWVGRNLNALRERNITPVAGLVHHGSGPSFTNLEDKFFPERLARYAGMVAKEFPWLDYYTPVNEPLTTARFSGLYGLWYPHKDNDRAFLKILLNQIRGIVLSMAEIRKINPSAKLVQTEDLGKTYSGSVLKYQADFENERRWLTYDLLCGRVDRTHPLWNYLIWSGLTEKELGFFTDNPCVPDIAGLNYYVTSERFLDRRLDHYPQHLWGGNHRHRYVDTEAVRVRHNGCGGLQVLLEEAWRRFGLPIVVTEAFLSCTPREHVLWLNEICAQASAARDNGVDIRGVTFWGLFGEFSWNKLVTSMDGEYESGAFDVWAKDPQETLVADFIRSVTASGTFDSEWLGEKGWWAKEDRYHLHEMCVNEQ
jgi:dTDP-4-dehydrorhamnose reductase